MASDWLHSELGRPGRRSRGRTDFCTVISSAVQAPAQPSPADTGRSFANYLHSFALFPTRGYIILFCNEMMSEIFYLQRYLFVMSKFHIVYRNNFQNLRNTKNLLKVLLSPHAVPSVAARPALLSASSGSREQRREIVSGALGN